MIAGNVIAAVIRLVRPCAQRLRVPPQRVHPVNVPFLLERHEIDRVDRELDALRVAPVQIHFLLGIGQERAGGAEVHGRREDVLNRALRIVAIFRLPFRELVDQTAIQLQRAREARVRVGLAVDDDVSDRAGVRRRGVQRIVIPLRLLSRGDDLGQQLARALHAVRTAFAEELLREEKTRVHRVVGVVGDRDDVDEHLARNLISISVAVLRRQPSKDRQISLSRVIDVVAARPPVERVEVVIVPARQIAERFIGLGPYAVMLRAVHDRDERRRIAIRLVHPPRRVRETKVDPAPFDGGKRELACLLVQLMRVRVRLLLDELLRLALQRVIRSRGRRGEEKRGEEGQDLEHAGPLDQRGRGKRTGLQRLRGSHGLRGSGAQGLTEECRYEPVSLCAYAPTFFASQASTSSGW